jgi:deazaflavin-dependent oxidoreductase (nitroreductase family)
MRLLARIARRIGASRALRPVVARIQTPIDRALMGHSHGRFHTMPAEFPTLLLTTMGRRSGRRRTVPLLYVTADDAIVVTDTNYGREPRPGWSANLCAQPSAEVVLVRARTPVVARRADGEERQRLWAALVAMWPGFHGYAERLDRTPRVWVLEPG